MNLHRRFPNGLLGGRRDYKESHDVATDGAYQSVGRDYSLTRCHYSVIIPAGEKREGALNSAGKSLFCAFNSAHDFTSRVASARLRGAFRG